MIVGAVVLGYVVRIAGEVEEAAALVAVPAAAELSVVVGRMFVSYSRAGHAGSLDYHPVLAVDSSVWPRPACEGHRASPLFAGSKAYPTADFAHREMQLPPPSEAISAAFPLV